MATTLETASGRSPARNIASVAASRIRANSRIFRVVPFIRLRVPSDANSDSSTGALTRRLA